MTLEQFLGNRYRLIARLPALGASHQRYAVQSSNGTPDYLVLSYCDYAKPISMDALGKQRRAAEVMMRPPVGLLCRITDFQFKPDHQWAVSEYPGDYSLRELLQQRQSLTMEEVEAFLRLLTEACEAATAQGWPRLQLEAGHLYLDARLGLPRIPAPDIPAFEGGGSEAADMDPMATMQFSAAALRAAMVDPLPKDTHEYVLPLAALACDLLGQPQHMRGGNARYQPVPQLTSQQNVLLRRALTSEGRAGFSSAKAFMDEFFGVSVSQNYTANTDRLRSLTVPPAHRVPTNNGPSAGAPPPLLTGPVGGGSGFTGLLSTGTVGTSENADAAVSFDAVTVKRPGPPPLPPSRPAGPSVAILRITAADRETAEKLGPTLRLRLVPDSEEAPIFALVGEDNLVLGRSASDADFIAQFRPRSNMNDARSRRVSRAQARVQLKDGKLVLEESEAVNPSVLQDSPIPGFAEVDLPVNFLLAGEFPVEARAIATDFVAGREVQDWPDPAGPGAKLHGAVILRPGGSGVLLCEAAAVLSDVGIHFSKSGRPWLRADSAAMPVARLQRFAQQFWFEPLESSVVAVASGTDIRSKTQELILLQDGAKVRLGPYGYTVQTYQLPTAAQSGTSQAA
jgi:hypothetical protein